MARPYWSGQLRLSLVSCPITLSPATTDSERIRLHQINPATGHRITLQPVDAESGESVDRNDLIKGYEIEKGSYVELTNEDLEDLKIESSHVLNLTGFVDRASIDPLYIDSSYYVSPDKNGVEAYRVIVQAMAKRRKAALGRIVLTTREHPVLVEPLAGGLLMTTLRSADEVRPAEFEFKNEKLNPEMVALAETIIEKMPGKFYPDKFRDRYQDALHDLIQAKSKGMKLEHPKWVKGTGNVVDLMSALKKSLEKNRTTPPEPTSKKRAPAPQDRRQGNIMLPVNGGSKAERRGAEIHRLPRSKKA